MKAIVKDVPLFDQVNDEGTYFKFTKNKKKFVGKEINVSFLRTPFREYKRWFFNEESNYIDCYHISWLEFMCDLENKKENNVGIK